VYSTCTLRRAENHAIIRRFLAEHPDYTGEPLSLPQGMEHLTDEENYCLTLFPGVYETDGFFIAKLRRNAS
jgi:16S rRNA (cytosine967-C5)-methyltransferase